MLKCNRTAGRLAWNPENTPPEIATALRALALEYAQLQESGTLGRTMVFERLPPGGGDGESRCEVLRGGERVVIRYGTLSSALRGVGFAMGMYPLLRGHLRDGGRAVLRLYAWRLYHG